MANNALVAIEGFIKRLWWLYLPYNVAVMQQAIVLMGLAVAMMAWS